jgi:hypothetical protein
MESTHPTLSAIVRRQKIVPIVLFAVVLLAFVNWILSPDRALHWLRVMLMLPVLWLGLTLWLRSTLGSLRRRGIEDVSAVRRYFDSAVSMAFLAVGVFQIVRLGLGIWVSQGDHGADLDAERRILGLASSAVFVIIGNALPKTLTPLAMLPVRQAELVTVARRFIGTTLVILGLVTALAYVSAPLAYARTLLKLAAGVSLVAVLSGIVWMNLSASRLEG